MKIFFSNNRGVALMLTIMIVSLIVALTLEFNRTMLRHVASAGNVGHGLKALYAAKSGIAFCKALLVADESLEVDTLLDVWADEENLKSVSNTVKNLYPCNKYKHMEGSGKAGDISIEDLAGKININSLVYNQAETEQEGNKGKDLEKDLERVFREYLGLELFGLEHEHINTIIHSVKDWIDPDDDGNAPGESESDYSYECKNAPIDSLHELRTLKGMTREEIPDEVFDKILQHLTIMGEGKININTADWQVLKSLHPDLTESMAKDMADFRRDSDETILRSIQWYYDAGVPEDIKLPASIVTIKSDFFRITYEGCFGNFTKSIEVVVKRKSDGIDVLSWEMDKPIPSGLTQPAFES